MSPDEAAGAVLCRAFFTDPVFQWVLPRDDDRRALEPWFTGMIRWGRKFGQVFTLGPEDAPTAVSIWGARPADTIEHVRAGLLGPTLGLGPRALYRFLRIGTALGGWHDRLCPEPHRYLYFIGVDPPHQRKGLGAELIRPRLEEADRAGLACYLETATDSNVTFYRRFEFQIAREGQVVAGAPSLWLLKRAPRST